MFRKSSACGLALALMFFLYSCVPQKRVTSSKKELGSVNNQLQQKNEILKQLDAVRADKESQNEMDDTASIRLKKYISHTRSEIDTLLKGNTILIGETVVEKSDWERLQTALTSSRNTAKRLNDKILFLNDLVSRKLVMKLDQDVIFEPGQYRVTPSVAKDMARQFEPAIREINQFSQKYPDFPLSLVINAKGYADAMTIGPGTPLYRDLKQRLNLTTTEPDNQELNKELSRARAEAVKTLFQSFADTQSVNKIFSTKVLYLYEGKGEILPDPTITDYKINDPRRRVVLLFWSIFPE